MHVLGPFRAETTVGVDVSPRSRKARALLGILALAPPEGIARNRVAGLLWDRVEPDQARNLLRGAIHEIRSCFGAAAGEVIQSTREHLSLRRDQIKVDIDALSGSDHDDETVADASIGDRLLLDGLENTGRAFDEWLSTARQDFRERVSSHLARHQRAEPARAPASDAAVRAAPPDTSAPSLPPTQRSARSGIRIGVVPLRSFGGVGSDPMALALTDEISAALSKFRWISVPPPDAVAAALGSDRNMQAAFTGLALDFLVDGQVQETAGKIRLRVSLVSAYEAAIVWTFKTDRDVADPLSLQDEIVAEVTARIDSHLFSTESHRVGSSALGSHDAYGLVMQAVRTACSLDPETFASSRDLLTEAIRLEPDRPMVHISQALFYLIAASQGWLITPREALKRAEDYANIALSMDPSEAQAWAITGYVRSVLYQQPEEAVSLLRRAIDMNPNLPLAWHFSTGNFLLLGDLPKAAACISRYEQLGPTGVHFFGDSALVTLCMLKGDDREAVRVGRTTMRMHPNFVAVQKPLLASLGHLGLREEAASVYAQLRRLEPTFSPEAFLGSCAFRRPQDRDRYAAGLRRAGEQPAD